jgi:putative colanic acid biosynthesis acetyltransferase WcaF
MRLDQYDQGSYTPGASWLRQVLWYGIGSPALKSGMLPFSGFKVWLLRSFGATIGQGVRIKPGVKIKFPWRLTVGDYVWIGEKAWLDNLAEITLDSHVCLSQGVYLCTGNHDWNVPQFSLRTAPIWIQSGSWIGAKAVVGPGVTVGSGAVLTLGSVANQDLDPMTIYQGNPAQPIKKRLLASEPQPSEIQPEPG